MTLPARPKLAWVADENHYFLYGDRFYVHVVDGESGWRFQAPPLLPDWKFAGATGAAGAKREAIRALCKEVRALAREAEHLMEKHGRAKSVKDEEAGR